MAADRNRRIFFASGVGAAQRIAQVLSSLVLLPMLIHELGVRGFGVWGAATSLAWLSGMLDLGIGSSMLTLLPLAHASGNGEGARSHVTAGLLCGVILAFLVLTIGCGSIAAGFRAADDAPLLVAVIGLAINIPLGMTASVWFGLQKGHVAGSWEFVQTVLSFVCVATLAALHAGVTALVAAVYVPMIVVNAASLVNLLLRHPELIPGWRYLSRGSIRRVLAEGGLLFGITVALTASYAFDNLFALQWLGAAASAQAAVALRICTLVAGMFAVLTQPLWPAFVEAVSTHDQSWAMRTLVRGTVAVAVLTGCGAIAIVTIGATVLQWWLGASVDLTPGLLWATAAWIVVLCMPRVASLLFNAASILKYQLAVAVVTLGLSLAFKPVLAHQYGAAGIVVAAPLAWLLVVWPAYGWLALRVRARLLHPESP
jgi:O-antigen/teichoic acid export membrane protein